MGRKELTNDTAFARFEAARGFEADDDPEFFPNLITHGCRRHRASPSAERFSAIRVSAEAARRSDKLSAEGEPGYESDNSSMEGGVPLAPFLTERRAADTLSVARAALEAAHESNEEADSDSGSAQPAESELVSEPDSTSKSGGVPTGLLVSTQGDMKQVVQWLKGVEGAVLEDGELMKDEEPLTDIVPVEYPRGGSAVSGSWRRNDNEASAGVRSADYAYNRWGSLQTRRRRMLG